MPAIGIDLGTTYSSVGVWQEGNVKVIANDQGKTTVPSYVTFTNSERLVGDVAKNQGTLNVQNTVFNVKMLIGKTFDSLKTTDLKHWPFKVFDHNGKPRILVNSKGENEIFAPEEISSMILLKLKETAEAYLRSPVKDAVITVPANFNNCQRQTTKDAASIAGLNVLRLINKSTAAALGHRLQNSFEGKQNILFFNLGGGSFNVSIVTIDDGNLFEVKASRGNTHLGGEDFSNRLVTHLADEFKRKFRKDLRTDAQALQRLRIAAEQAKHSLSLSPDVNIEINALHEGIDFNTKVSRSGFEELCSKQFRSLIQPVEKALNDARMDRSSIHNVVLVGGSCNIPKIQNLLQNFFSESGPTISIIPQETAACGAAIQAAILSAEHTCDFKHVLVDVAYFSLHYNLAERPFCIINMNSRIPHKQNQSIKCRAENNFTAEIEVYEGERKMVEDNNLLGTFHITGLPPAPSGQLGINATFQIDISGILSVFAKDDSNDKPLNVTQDLKGCLSKEEMDRMIIEAQKWLHQSNLLQCEVGGK